MTQKLWYDVAVLIKCNEDFFNVELPTKRLQLSQIYTNRACSFSNISLFCLTIAVCPHYSDAIMSAMASQITGVSIDYSTVYSGAYKRKHQSSTSLAFVRGIHRWPVNSPHKGTVTRKMVPFDDVIIIFSTMAQHLSHSRYACMSLRLLCGNPVIDWCLFTIVSCLFLPVKHVLRVDIETCGRDTQ